MDGKVVVPCASDGFWPFIAGYAQPDKQKAKHQQQPTWSASVTNIDENGRHNLCHKILKLEHLLVCPFFIMFGILTATWHDLPSEMQLVVIDFLGGDDVASLSKVDQRTYRVCVPARFKVCLYVLHF